MTVPILTRIRTVTAETTEKGIILNKTGIGTEIEGGKNQKRKDLMLEMATVMGIIQERTNTGKRGNTVKGRIKTITTTEKESIILKLMKIQHMIIGSRVTEMKRFLYHMMRKFPTDITSLCQLVEVLLNLLILVCGAISYSGTGGYTDLSSLGSLYYYTFGSAYSGFQGEEAKKVNELDVAFYQLKLPTVIAIMAYGGALMSFACLLLVLGLARVPWRFPFLMIIECALDIAIALAYIPAVYFYFQHLIAGYNSEVCKEREGMYKSKGYDGFNCSLHGADIVGGLCGCLAIIVYLLNAVAAILAFRKVRRLKSMREEVYLESTIV
ncbi:MARVEL domain-containing protein 3 isoform X2 [Heterodontus francisci]|uniref:MARVEL domain-containing protein 3 isoform X2 n=1 Tax=Heterodontus francisci TaxID=7792 RepID=UPI00355C098A